MRWRIVPALLGAAFLVAGCAGGVSQGEALDNGRQLFLQGDGDEGDTTCASCHTLEAAPASGTIGPNLDDAFRAAREDDFEESTFEQVVREQIRTPGVGSVMQPDLLTGQDADDVAHFVARCAANADEAACLPPEGGGVTATDGAEIFAQAGCGSCHTLAAADSTGTIGPNLDETQPSVELAVDRVTNGSGAMPSFAGELSEEQIQAVADYVAQNAGP